jgi:peptide methionine sulfoxide reductase MsrB|tara:strand:+ start:2962 stop:3180 length:219 start_codon:yes stop_codon:yes gene_type:complete
MKYTICRFCGEEYNKKRFDLGYLSCLDCGQIHAEKEKNFKSKCTAPAFNKGAYQYITSIACVKGIFKCGSTK